MHALLVGSLFLMVLTLAGQSHAADLNTIERKIAKEPLYQSPAVGYCLLVFGREAQTRIWLVHDGEKLHVDRNGNGDLTEANEVVTAKTGEWSEAAEGVFQFEAGDLYDGKLTHKRLEVSFFKIDYAADRDPEVKAWLAKNPRRRGVSMGLEVELPGKRGDGKGGRVRHILSHRDLEGI